jgi:hypothetical protein
VQDVRSNAYAADTALDPSFTSTCGCADENASLRPKLEEAPVTLVVIHGAFVDTLAKVPEGEPAPEGTVMADIVNSSGRVASTYVGETTPALATLGPVQTVRAAKLASTIRLARRLIRTGSLIQTRSLRTPLAKLKSVRQRAKAATWAGGQCRQATLYHCYVEARWTMGKGEEVEGAIESQDTTIANVPGSEKGAFADQEEWVGFKAGQWLEEGQQAGEFKGCCQLWWFYARQYAAKEYQQWVDEPYVWPVATGQENEYMMKSTNPNESIWCVYYPTNTIDTCFGGRFPIYDKHSLTAGDEIATEERPIISGQQIVIAEHLGKGEWYDWNSAAYELGPELCAETGGSGPPPYAAGDMYLGTCVS